MTGMCKDCFSGSLHEGSPTGRVETVHDLPTYIAEPEDPASAKGIVVVISDAFGWELPNLRVLCDNYAKTGGFKVLMPDLMNGHWAAHSVLDSAEIMMGSEHGILARIRSGLHAISNFIPFLFFNRFSVTGPRVYTWFLKLRASEPSNKIGAAGFCWGGKWTFWLASPADANPATEGYFKAAQAGVTNVVTLDASKPLIDAGYTAHPSFLELPADAERVISPVSVANGSEDMQVTKEKAPLLESAFAKLNAAAGEQKYTYVNYEGAKHGFAVRWNTKSEQQNKQGAEAEAQAIDFFKKWLV